MNAGRWPGWALGVAVLAGVVCTFGVRLAGAASAQPGPAGREAAVMFDPQAGSGSLAVLDSKGKPAGMCPLKHTSVRADVAGFVAQVDVTQEFVNSSKTKIEAVYTFPLPEDSAVHSMSMIIGKRTIRGIVKRREEAREIYEQAKATGRVASLLEQERPNIFTQSVANILPGESVLIKISYLDELTYEDGRYEFLFPMVVGPRFIPGEATGRQGTGAEPDTTEVPDASKITPPIALEGTRAGHDISLQVTIDAGGPVQDITSVLHEISARRTRSGTIVSLASKKEIPNRDFILRWGVSGETVQTMPCVSTRRPGEGYLGLVLVPPEKPAADQVTPKEMIFVIDSSGSQSGWPIEKSKETMALCIEQMNPDDTFQLLAFSNEVIPLFGSPQPNTEANRQFAQEFLASRLGGGGTYLLNAIQHALRDQNDPDRLRIVCFMTDGYVGNDMEIIDFIEKNAGEARVFSFGIGNSVNRFLLDEMARAGNGDVEYVTLPEKGSAAAAKFAERIGNPLLTDITIDWGDLPVSDAYPTRIPDLFSSKPVVVKARYEVAGQGGGIGLQNVVSGTVTVHGNLGGSPWSTEVPVDLPMIAPYNKPLPYMWARAKIASLTAQDYQNIQKGAPSPVIQEMVTETALEYQLMSQFTSFVAVEEMRVTRGGKPVTIAVPVELPEGLDYGVFADKVTGQNLNKALGFYALSAPTARQSSAHPATPAAGVALGFGGAAKRATTVAGDAPEMSASAPATGREPLSTDEQRQLLLEGRLDPVLQDLAKKLGEDPGYASTNNIDIDGDMVRVKVRAIELNDEWLAKLREAGMEIDASNSSVCLVLGRLPIDQIEAVALLEFVVRIEHY